MASEISKHKKLQRTLLDDKDDDTLVTGEVVTMM